MQSFKKILRANSKKNGILTDGLTDGLTDKHEYIGPLRRAGGPIMEWFTNMQLHLGIPML